MPRETYVPQLLQLFRQYGYDGATLSKISAATGLGKASLYHYFPGGKDEMVEAVLDFLERWLDDNLLPALYSENDALSRLQHMCDRISEVYVGGRSPCMLAILLQGSARDTFHQQVNQRLQVWMGAIATVLVEAGMEPTLAQQRSEDALIAIQGSLILSQGLGNPSPFQRVMQQLPQVLCQGL